MCDVVRQRRRRSWTVQVRSRGSSGVLPGVRAVSPDRARSRDTARGPAGRVTRRAPGAERGSGLGVSGRVSAVDADPAAPHRRRLCSAWVPGGGSGEHRDGGTDLLLRCARGRSAVPCQLLFRDPDLPTSHRPADPGTYHRPSHEGPHPGSMSVAPQRSPSAPDRCAYQLPAGGEHRHILARQALAAPSRPHSRDVTRARDRPPLETHAVPASQPANAYGPDTSSATRTGTPFTCPARA
jgi:hypothetical protein